jgi:putative spermidine/putrescine transport system ATP-binding protein
VLRDGEVRQVGTPQELYANPAAADVAEFMGYRNLVSTRGVSAEDGRLRVRVGAAELLGTPTEEIGGAEAIIAIRPDDLVPRPNGPLAAKVETAEYRGRDFYGTARTPEGLELFFRSEIRVTPGETVTLGADPAQVRIYRGAGPV